MIQFPKDFFWGAATSSHQVEGNNSNNDWWEWEKRAGLKDVSGSACRHYELYKQDFDLAKELNHNAHRLSIEWSRLEPKRGEFSAKEIEHYKDVILSLRERKLEPIVTLHHFTNPLWFSRLGGWKNKNSAKLFLPFVEKIVEALSDKVHFWVTINEPMVYVYHSYFLGAWPPQEKSVRAIFEVTDNMVEAHVKAYRLIHQIYKKNNLPTPSVSIAQNVQAFEICRKGLKNTFSRYLREKYYNFDFLDRIKNVNALDYIGVNYYSRHLVDAKGWGPVSLFTDDCGHSRLKTNSLGWDIYPEGLRDVLIKFKKYNLPLFILENGICTEDDNLRWEFIFEHLKNINLAMQQGVKVLGYIYWSLIDNFEWDKGFGPRFGLIDVDYNTYKRTIRESARKFAVICKTGKLE
jgi:beta-glucosidase